MNFQSLEAIDVIVPVFNGNFDIVYSCIESVIAALAANKCHVSIIDDKSTDRQIIDYINSIERVGAVDIFRNEVNLGFVQTVNRGMKLHKDMDVILLNSDTLVYGDWAKRMRDAAYADKRIATVNPLSNGWMSNYPDAGKYSADKELEVSDAILNDLCNEVNAGRFAQVPSTIGFCMLIKRRCLNEIGLFDQRNFPTGYGEETDFCYRASALGWTHIVVGDVFVRHWENQSFTSERKQKLLLEAERKFQILHPRHRDVMNAYSRVDTQKPLRENLDLARLKRLFGSRKTLPVLFIDGIGRSEAIQEPLFLAYDQQENSIALKVNWEPPRVPNLRSFRMPRDVVQLNKVLSHFDVDELCFASPFERDRFGAVMTGLALEVGISAKLTLDVP